MRNCIIHGMTGCAEECRQILSVISEYLDLELPPDIRTIVETHLAHCARCEEFTDGLRRSVALARVLGASAKAAPLSREARAELKRAWERCGQRRSRPA